MKKHSENDKAFTFFPEYLTESIVAMATLLALSILSGSLFYFVVTNWNADLVGKILPPFGAAFLGALAAYYLGLKKEEIVARKEKISAANRAIFALADLSFTAKQLQADCIEPVRANPNRWLDMTTPRANSLQNIELDMESISFLLDSPSSKSKAPTTLFDLRKLNSNYNMLLRTIDLRSDAIESKLQPELNLLQPRPSTSTAAAELIKASHYPVYVEVQDLTNHFVESVDAIISESHRLYVELHRGLREFFPDQEFITVSFLEPEAFPEA